MKNINFKLLLLIIVFSSVSFAKVLKKVQNAPMKSAGKLDISKTRTLYREAQREFGRKNYPGAIKLFDRFVVLNKKRNDDFSRDRVFWSIDLVVRIHLKINKDPDSAVLFLNKIKGIVKLNEAEEDSINEWITVSNQWKKLGQLPKNITSKEDLFKLGQLYYKKAMERIQFPADDSGNADFYIASTYLIPYIYNYDKSKNIGKALFMLGNTQLRSWNDYEYWSENFYLKEVIRRYPHSDLAKRAYKSLEEGVHLGYTGSGGDFTPPSQVKMLNVYKKLSESVKIKKPIIY